MKKIFTLLLLLALTLQAQSQAWMPINATEKFFYKIDHSDFIEQSLYVDSITVSGLDTVWHLNRTITLCNTCIDYKQFDYCQRGINHQGILKKRLIKHPNESIYLEGDENVVLLPLAETGQSWLYDTLNNVTATVGSIDTLTIWGQIDSVKTISLSNGGGMLLSKSFGIYEFRDSLNSPLHSLTGIEGRNLGDQVPSFFQIFDFHPGDVLQYHYHQFTAGVAQYWPDFFDEQRTIVSAIIDPTGVNVVYSRIIGCYTANQPGPCFYDPTTQDTVHEFIPYYPHNKYDLYPGGKYDTTNAYCCFPSHPQFLPISLDSVEFDPFYNVVPFKLAIKRYGSVLVTDTTSCFTQGVYYEAYPDVWVPEYRDDYIYESYANGLGLVQKNNYGFEHVAVYNLTGYVKNGDTVGLVSRPLITNIESHANQSLALKIYPNPASSILNIYLPQQVGVAGILQCTLTDMQGKTVRAWDMEKLSSVPVHDLPSGIYMLSVLQNGRVLGAEQVLIDR